MLSKNQIKYKEEYEKYKSIVLSSGYHRLKNKKNIIYEILEIDERAEKVILENSYGLEIKKTLHWCRKNLEPI